MVKKKANHCICFNFGDIQLREIMNFLGGATSLDPFLVAYKSSETKRFIHYEWFDGLEKPKTPNFPRLTRFTVNCLVVILLKLNTRNVRLVKSGRSVEQAVAKMKLSKPPATGNENYQYLQEIWEHELMSSFKDFLRWYNNKDVSTL